jgi:sirohydrochlorin ferrochelatase
MKNVIVLAMHGSPPSDFPKQETMELFNLHARLGHSGSSDADPLAVRYVQLEEKMRNWPRTVENDPFHNASFRLAHELEQKAGCAVFVGFNEFCAPNIDQALEQAAQTKPDKILVVTPMMTRGGEHAEVDIPQAIQRAQAQFPEVVIKYVWPFEPWEVAEFLASQIQRFE